MSEATEDCTATPDTPPPGINTFNEKSLHADLKAWYAQPGDLAETHVDGFIVDLVHGDLLVEIQTRNVSAIRRKLTLLADQHCVRLVYPIAECRWILKQTADGQAHSPPRKSPKRGRVEHVFAELVSIPKLLAHDNFSLEILLIHEEEVRRPNPRPGWRRKEWSTHERHLVRVLERRVFERPADLAALLPATFAEPFTTQDLAQALSLPRRLAQRMTYCLRLMGAIEVVGKSGNSLQYRRKC